MKSTAPTKERQRLEVYETTFGFVEDLWQIIRQWGAHTRLKQGKLIIDSILDLLDQLEKNRQVSISNLYMIKYQLSILHGRGIVSEEDFQKSILQINIIKTELHEYIQQHGKN